MDLKFDKMTVDTSLAQDYLESSAVLFELYQDYIGYAKKNSPFVYDGEYFAKKPLDDYLFHGTELGEYKDRLWNRQKNLQQNLLELASFLKQNATLITQLEYHFRNIPIADTNSQLKLIIQYLKSHVITKRVQNYSSYLKISPDDPLLHFATLMDMLLYSGRCIALVSVSRETAFISHLFVTLCHSAGLNNLILAFEVDLIVDPPVHVLERKQPVRGLNSGTLAVVSEDADVDSAVDTFITASVKAPWRLRKILVQESVCQLFKDALSWKCSKKNLGSQSQPADNILCSNTRTCNGRTFVIDPVEVLEEQASVVPVEAYRTTKEMLAMVQKDQTRYLSLWSNGIAQINEITHNTTAPIVWVNNIADFRGPPQVAQALFSYVFPNEVGIKKCGKISKLCELSQSWLKLDVESRREILMSVSDTFRTLIGTKTSLLNFNGKSFVDLGKDYVCLGMSKPVGIKGFAVNEYFFNADNFKSLLLGNAFVLYSLESDREPEFDDLQKAGIPVVDVGSFVEGDFFITNESAPYSRTRVVWTNSGTIFAN